METNLISLDKFSVQARQEEEDTFNFSLWRYLFSDPINSINHMLIKLKDKKCGNYRSGYIELLALVGTKDVESLDQLTISAESKTLQLAEQLIGVNAFWNTITECVHSCILSDVEAGSLTKAEGNKFIKCLYNID